MMTTMIMMMMMMIKFGSHTRKKKDNRIATKDSCTFNITFNTESTAVWNGGDHSWLKSRSTREKRTVIGDDNNNNDDDDDESTWNVTHNTESTAVWNLTSERWGSPLVQEQKYEGEKDCDRR